MLFCGALERSNNPYIKPIVEPSVFKNQKEILGMWICLERKYWKRTGVMVKKYPWAESGICVCVKRKKKTVLKSLYSFLRHLRNVNLLFKKDFKSAELLSKTSFFLYFRDRPINGEGNKGEVESICARVTKHASKKVAKAEVNWNWLWIVDYGLFWLCILSMDALANLMQIFSLVSWFLYFLQHLL